MTLITQKMGILCTSAVVCFVGWAMEINKSTNLWPWENEANYRVMPCKIENRRNYFVYLLRKEIESILTQRPVFGGCCGDLLMPANEEFLAKYAEIKTNITELPDISPQSKRKLKFYFQAIENEEKNKNIDKSKGLYIVFSLDMIDLNYICSIQEWLGLSKK